MPLVDKDRLRSLARDQRQHYELPELQTQAAAAGALALVLTAKSPYNAEVYFYLPNAPARVKRWYRGMIAGADLTFTPGLAAAVNANDPVQMRRVSRENVAQWPEWSDLVLGPTKYAPVGDPAFVADEVIVDRESYFSATPFSPEVAQRVVDAPPKGSCLDDGFQTMERCFGLLGARGLDASALDVAAPGPNVPVLADLKPPILYRTYIADLVWLFYYERMGAFQIIGALLDDYATRGRFPLRSDTLVAASVERMVRLVKSGLASSTRDRDSTYRRCLGWTIGNDLDGGRGSVQSNIAFSDAFHAMLRAALTYYREMQLTEAIKGSSLVPNAYAPATIGQVNDAIDALQKSVDPFERGRSQTNTLGGLVWLFGGLAAVRGMRDELGLSAQKLPYQYIPAAYDVLVRGRENSAGEVNRYMWHHQAANSGRAILLDAQVLDISKPDNVEAWLVRIANEVEKYRSAYRALTGIDLGAKEVPAIEQRAA